MERIINFLLGLGFFIWFIFCYEIQIDLIKFKYLLQKLYERDHLKTSAMSLAFDETGRPFIILREQGKKKRVKGAEAHKVSDDQIL